MILRLRTPFGVWRNRAEWFTNQPRYLSTGIFPTYYASGTLEINPSTGAVTNHVEVESGHELGSGVNALAGGPPTIIRISNCGINRTCAFLLHFRDSQSFPDGPDFLSLYFSPGINITALAVSPSGQLYGWDQQVGLVTIKPAPWSVFTDAVTAINSQGRPQEIPYDNPIRSIQFTENGKLIGIQAGSFNTTFFEIDTSSGSVKFIGGASIGISSFARMVASAATPPP